MKVKYKKLDARAMPPTYGSTEAAAGDLRALLDDSIVIPPHSSSMIHTGIAVELPKGTVGCICARSGIASKRGLAPANKFGIVDAEASV